MSVVGRVKTLARQMHLEKLTWKGMFGSSSGSKGRWPCCYDCEERKFLDKQQQYYTSKLSERVATSVSFTHLVLQSMYACVNPIASLEGLFDNL